MLEFEFLTIVYVYFYEPLYLCYNIFIMYKFKPTGTLISITV